MTPTQLEVRLTAELIAQQEAQGPSEAVRQGVAPAGAQASPVLLRSRARLRLLTERRAAARMSNGVAVATDSATAETKTLHNTNTEGNGHV